MVTETISGLSRRVQDYQGHDRLFLSYSTGIDATAAWLRCLESEVWDPARAVLYYYHHVPMSWSMEYLDWFEAKFGVRVIRVPSHIYLRQRANWLYQRPETVRAIAALQKTDLAYRQLSRDDIQNGVRIWSGLGDNTLCAVGVKSGDSPMRRKQMRMTEGFSPKTARWYPIWDFENRDALDIIKRHGCKIPYDYELFGITYENIDYRFSKVIRDECPENWKKIIAEFPLLDRLLTRHEYYHPERAAKKGVKYRKLSNLVLQPRGAL